MTKKISKNRSFRIGLFTKLDDKESLRISAQLISLMNKNSTNCMMAEEAALHLLRKSKPSLGRNWSPQPIDQIVQQAQLLVVVGGDGTILRAARHLLNTDGWKNCSLLGVNAGHVGFLTFLNYEEFGGAFRQIIKGNRRKIERRACLQVSIERKKKVYRKFHVLNDAVLSKGTLSRIFEFHIFVDDRFLSSYRSDGLIVSTPTGSTAYNLAAGGAILEPEISAVQLTPICPQSFSNKPIVLDDSRQIQLKLGRHSSDVYLTLDGHTGLRIENDDIIRIERSPKSVNFALPEGMEDHYFRSLRQKLKWGLVSASSA